MLACTRVLLLRAVHMLDEGTMPRLFTSEHLRVIRDFAHAGLRATVQLGTDGARAPLLRFEGVREERTPVRDCMQRRPNQGGFAVQRDLEVLRRGGLRNRVPGALLAELRATAGGTGVRGLPRRAAWADVLLPARWRT